MKPKSIKKVEAKPKKDKSQSKRLKTFSSSQFSQWEQKNKVMQGSATDLTILKQQAIANRRAQNNSALSQYTNPKSPTIKLTGKKKKKTGTKTKPKVKKIEQQEFQRAKYKQSNSQSQIVFSNDQTKRQSCVSMKDVKYIETMNNYESDSNLVLRINIKKQYVRKVQAATKIQKVFRGYMTRKILLKCICDEEEKLKSQLAANQDLSSFRQNSTHRTFADKDGQNLMNRLFQNRAVADINFNHTIRGRAGDFQQEDQHQSSSNKKGQKQKGESILKNEALAYINRNQNWMQKQQQQNSQEQQSNEQQEQEDDDTNMLYRRQNPIYSQQQISQYLESSSQQEEEEELDAYQPEIIFQTNEQYIQSRKSSLQNKNEPINKLSNKSISDLVFINQGGLEDKIRKQLKEQAPNLRVTRKKESEEQFKTEEKQIMRDESKQNNIEKKQKELKSDDKSIENKTIQKVLPSQPNMEEKQDEDIFQTIYVNFNSEQKASQSQIQKNKTEVEQEPKICTSRSDRVKPEKSQKGNHQKLLLTDKIQISPRREVKYLDEHDMNSNSSSNNSSRLNKSRVSAQQKQILRLREQECQKWDQVIRMVSQQIKRSNENNQQMVSFMKNIMEFSQKNKQLLGSTRSVNSESESFTTPTSMGVQIKEGAKSLGLPTFGEIQQLSKKQQEKDAKFLKKKKPLKIDILDSNSLRQQKQSIISDKSENNYKNSKFEFEKEKKFVRSSRNIQQLEEKRKNDFENYHHHALAPLSKSAKTQIAQCLQNSKNLKKFLSSNIQVQDEAIYQILKLREQLLQKRESEELIKLNNQLSKSELSQQKFLEKLSQLTRKFVQQKQIIDKAKDDIFKGYQAATNLVKQYFFDVRRMGIKMTVSKSQDNLKYKFGQPGYFGDIKIDQLTPKSTPKSEKRNSIKGIFDQHEIYEQNSKQKSLNIHHSNIQSSEDSSIDFTEEELKRFRKAANYDLEFNYLNKNMTTISDQFIKQQRKCFQQQGSAQIQDNSQFIQSPEQLKIIKNLQPHRQTYLLDQSKTPSTRTPPHIQAIIQNEINRLMWQFASELMLRPEMSEKFIQKPSIIRPSEIKIEQKLQFLQILQENLPDKTVLHRKLNQNISPLPHQILKCMRLDFSEEAEEEEDENYQQINRYQFVISQEACAKSVMLFKNNVDQAEQRKEVQQIQRNNQFFPEFQETVKNIMLSEKITKFILQRQKFLKNKKQHTRELRWEVMNIELHCIFDSWNEQIIQICSTRPGFSGIGLNEVTLSMKNHNRSVPLERSQPLITQAKEKVMEILTDDTDINVKILRENFHEMCENDSAWVFYADQALSYGLELVYLVEQDIYSQFTRELRKIMMKSSLAI